MYVQNFFSQFSWSLVGLWCVGLCYFYWSTVAFYWSIYWSILLFFVCLFCFCFFFWSIFTSLVLQMENNLLTMREAQVQSLGRADDPLEKEMATHSIIFAWSVPRTEEPGGLQSIVLQRVGQD